MPARIEDVAAHAGVSIKTVSRVLNGRPSVRANLRARIEASIEALNYVPNASARGLALLYDNPTAGSAYIMELIVGVLQACRETPYTAELYPLDDSDKVTNAIDGLLARNRPDGLILVPPHANNVNLLQHLHDRGVRYSTISSKARETRSDVGFDEREAATEMVQHLIALGHRRIGHITGLKGHGARTWRLGGYRDALRKAGIEYDETLVVEGDFMFESGVEGARRLLDLRRPPTAIFAANDDMAFGVMREAHARRIDVPGTLSICGFDDTPTSQLVSPGLSTVHQPCREMGRMAAAYNDCVPGRGARFDGSAGKAHEAASSITTCAYRRTDGLSACPTSRSRPQQTTTHRRRQTARASAGNLSRSTSRRGPASGWRCCRRCWSDSGCACARSIRTTPPRVFRW